MSRNNFFDVLETAEGGVSGFIGYVEEFKGKDILKISEEILDTLKVMSLFYRKPNEDCFECKYDDNDESKYFSAIKERFIEEITKVIYDSTESKTVDICTSSKTEFDNLDVYDIYGINDGVTFASFNLRTKEISVNTTITENLIFRENNKNLKKRVLGIKTAISSLEGLKKKENNPEVISNYENIIKIKQEEITQVESSVTPYEDINNALKIIDLFKNEGFTIKQSI